MPFKILIVFPFIMTGKNMIVCIFYLYLFPYLCPDFQFFQSRIKHFIGRIGNEKVNRVGKRPPTLNHYHKHTLQLLALFWNLLIKQLAG
jgi:hypothetical protein